MSKAEEYTRGYAEAYCQQHYTQSAVNVTCTTTYAGSEITHAFGYATCRFDCAGLPTDAQIIAAFPNQCPAAGSSSSGGASSNSSN